MEFVEFQERMRKAAEDDKNNRHVTVTADTLPDALQKASIELGTPLAKLAYEIMQAGTKGVMGFGKKPFLVMAYPSLDAEDTKEESLDFGFSFDTQSNNRDGHFYIHRSPQGIMLKVMAPLGSGSKVTDAEVISALEQKTTESLNLGFIAKAVKRPEGVWIKVADMNHDPNQDARISLELAEMEMKAYVTITRPGPFGADVDANAVRSYLQYNNVCEGLKEEVISGLEDDPRYGESVLVAEGTKAVNGADSRVVYTFETGNKINLKQIDGGRVDFKELNTIQNVVEGQVLAKYIPPGRGEPGRTVTGKYLPAKDGRELPFEVGQNVRLSDDRKQAIAAVNGQVVLSGGKITVEPIYLVEGDVGVRTGNILFLGSVEVKGNVEDGYSVKAAGNIEIHGTVGRCVIDAEGDVVVHNGITGRNEGSINAGGNIWSKFIENANASAGGIVVVNEGIVNSNVTCDHKIICRGKRANVVGGKLIAAEEIDAKTLGSVAGAETICQVGFDPKTKAKLDELDHKIKSHEKELSDLELNMASIENALRGKKEMNPEKKAVYDAGKKRMFTINKELDEFRTELQQLEQYLDELKSNGRVSASDKVYPGVKVFIKEYSLEVRNDFKRVTFLLEGGIVKVTKYEESDQDISIPQVRGGKG